MIQIQIKLKMKLTNLMKSHLKSLRRKQQTKRVYVSHCRSAMDFAGLAWQPWLWRRDEDKPKEAAKKLERAQNKCLRTITGQAEKCPVEALQCESGIAPYVKSTMKANIMKGREKGLRMPDDHPRKKILE